MHSLNYIYMCLFIHRCVADHHREGEYPFLDENVVMFLQQLPIWDKVGHNINDYLSS